MRSATALTTFATAFAARGYLPHQRLARDASGRTKKRLKNERHLGNALTEHVEKFALSKEEEWESPANGLKYTLQTQTMSDVGKTTHVIRSLDWDRDRFDIEFGLEKGTTYNSYVIEYGDNKVVLVDCSHEKFETLYMDALLELIGDMKRIEYIVCSHTEPDHSGLIGKVLETATNATVVGTKVCLAFLDNLVQKEFKQMVVKGGDAIDLGEGRQLKFIPAPNLHWPDTMFTYDTESELIFTCDAFGAHYCTEDVFDQSLQKLKPHFSFYYECLMKPNARSVLTALRKCETDGAKLSTVCTGHGPILKLNSDELIGDYKKWSEKALEKAKASVAVFYTADYGYSDRLSQSVARGIVKTDCEVAMIDLSTCDAQQIVEEVGRASGIVLLAPPNANEEIQDNIGVLIGAVKPGKQKILVAESYGGDDEPVDPLMRKFAEIGLQESQFPLKCQEAPTEGTYQEYEEAGTDLGQLLTQKEKLKEMKSGMSADVARALGRVSGGLYIVTAVQGTAKSAMVASWIAQASFEPLGFTIAVAKDRAIESLMQVGDSFVLNCLGEDGFEAPMKHFLKRFPPGADRFEGVDWKPAKCGSPILADAVSYVECKVVSRMDANDHWIIYSEAVDGGVFNQDAKTASHFRKVASYY
jgi:flavorubredoxin/flavin reductase (DIM6/NTAB) family NADH-FMN oxidoreductase RutF